MRVEEPARVSPEVCLCGTDICPPADPSRQQLSDCSSPGSAPCSVSSCALQAPGNESAAAAGSQPQLCPAARSPLFFVICPVFLRNHLPRG